MGSGQREFIEVKVNVFQICIWVGDILVVEVDYVNVMMLIEVFICLQCGVWQLVDQVFILDVGFMECWRGVFLVIFLIYGIGNVSIEIKIFIFFFLQFLVQFQFCIGFIFVIKMVFILSVGCFEVLLFVVVVGLVNVGMCVVMEIDSQCLSRYYVCCDGDCQRKFVQSNYYFIF